MLGQGRSLVLTIYLWIKKEVEFHSGKSKDWIILDKKINMAYDKRHPSQKLYTKFSIDWSVELAKFAESSEVVAKCSYEDQLLKQS